MAAALFAGLPWAIARARGCSSSSSSSAAPSAAAAVAFLRAHADAAEGIQGLERLGASLRRLAEAPNSDSAAGVALREAVKGLISGRGGGGRGQRQRRRRRRRAEALRLSGVTLSSPTATNEHRKAALRMLTAVLLLRFKAESARTAGAGSSNSEDFFGSSCDDGGDDATVALSAAVASLGGNLGDEGLAALRAALAVSVRVSRGRRGCEEEEEEEEDEENKQRNPRPPPSTSAERAALAVDALSRVARAWPKTAERPLVFTSR